MAKMIPERFPEQVLNAGEIELFCKLRDEPGTLDWTVLHAVCLGSVPERPEGAGEIDFVVLIPHQGIVCLDIVSAARVTRENGQWIFGTGNLPPSEDPFVALHGKVSALRSYLIERDPAFAKSPIACGVVFTRAHAEVIGRGGPATWPEWELVDTNKFLFNSVPMILQELLEKTRLSMGVDELAAAHFSEMQCDKVAKLLRTPKPSSNGESAERELTLEQARALASIERNPRMIITGAAGTGKTFLALEAARSATAESERVLVLCSSSLLCERMAREAARLTPSIVVRTVLEHMRLAAGLGIDELAQRAKRDGRFLEVSLPRLACERLATGKADEHIFPKLIVDEAQEMLHDGYLDVMDLSLSRGLERGRWVIFGDFDDRQIYQRSSITIRDMIYSRCKYIPHFYSLNTNCRSAKSIAEFVHKLIADGLYSETLSDRSSPSPRVLYYGDSDEQRRLLVECLEELGRDGYASDDLVVISGRPDGKTVAQTIDDPSWQTKLRPLSGSDGEGVRFGSVREFLGLDAPVIIVTDVDELHEVRGSLLYQALTRAKERLIVLSHVSQRDRLELQIDPS